MKAWHVDDAAFESLRRLAGTPAHAAAQVEAAEPDRATPPELEPAVTALESQNYGAALGLAEPFVRHPDAAMRADPLRLCALACSRLGQWTALFDHYYRLFEIEATALNAV